VVANAVVADAAVTGAAVAAVRVGGLPGAPWPEYLADDAVRERCLDAVVRLGFALLRGVPVAPGTVTAVAETFGFVRETNNGRLFDVRVVADPANLAFTSRELAPHTDNPYRDPVPTLQLLHCLRDAVSGGDTGLIDGFAAAAALRAEDPASFSLLTTIEWPFAYIDKETELRATQPLISLTPAGRITGVRLNDRAIRPLRGVPARQAEAAYAAYRAWENVVARPEFRLTLRLAPGDCLIFDNTRILHARTAFDAPAPAATAPAAATPSTAPAAPAATTPAAAPAATLATTPAAATPSTAPAAPAATAPAAAPVATTTAAPSAPSAPSAAGERHLQGCYADIDGLLSTLAVLDRRTSIA
jgi:alpha-ketoglutarate-dependent taurine dioxygenase